MDERAQLLVLGMSAQTASRDELEAVALDRSEAAATLDVVRGRHPGTEALVLSTCNRVEFYIAGSGVTAAAQTAFEATHRLRDQAIPPLPAAPAGLWYLLHDAEATRHLLRVASGLESAILGDVQIQSQVRAAQGLAIEHGTFGEELHRAVSLALRTGRRARRETTIAEGSPGVASAVTGLLERRLGNETAVPTILVLGAGSVAAAVTRKLSRRKLGRVVVINRTFARAAELADRHGAVAREWSDLSAQLEHATAVVAATSSPDPVLSSELLDAVANRRRVPTRLLVLDAGLPRNVVDTPSVDVVSLESIAAQDVDLLGDRERAVPAVEAMIEDAVADWERQVTGYNVELIIKALYRESDALSREIARTLVTTDDGEDATRLVHRSLKRMLHPHVCRLREFADAAQR
jgi:glutamyl-tRNA reductase